MLSKLKMKKIKRHHVRKKSLLDTESCSPMFSCKPKTEISPMSKRAERGVQANSTACPWATEDLALLLFPEEEEINLLLRSI